MSVSRRGFLEEIFGAIIADSAGERDPEKGQPRGPAQLVRHFHNFRAPGGGGASVISTGVGNAITKDQFLLDYTTAVSNIWTMRLPLTR